MKKKNVKRLSAVLLICVIMLAMLPADRVYAEKYDPKGVWVETECAETNPATGNINLFRYGYDMYGRRTQSIRYFSGEFVTWKEYEYSNRGLKTKESNYEEDRQLTDYTEYIYESDDEYITGLRLNVYDKTGVLIQYSVWNNGIMDCYDAKGAYIGGYSAAIPSSGYGYTQYMNEKTGRTTVVTNEVEGIVSGYYISEEDKYGNVVKTTYYHSDRTVDYWIEYKYVFDDNHNPLRKSAYKNGTELLEIEEYKYEYDSKNNMTKEISMVNGMTGSYTMYEYDENGNNTKKIYCSADGEEGSYDVFEYDTAGNRIKKTYYSPTGEMNSSYSCVYDGFGNMIKETVYNGSGEKVFSAEYDQDGEQTKYILYDGGKGLLLYERIEDIAKYYNEDGSLQYILEYDDNGNCIRETKYSSGTITSITDHKYVYLTYGTKVPVEPLSESEKEKLQLYSSGYEFNDKYVPDDYTDKSGSPMISEGLDCAWNEASGKSFWYENGIKQGTYYDTNGVLGDNTIRGREIYDAKSNGWYWLDSVYNGAKAEGKEVWIPYIYQEELTLNSDGAGRYANGINDEAKIRELAQASNTYEAEMADQVEAAIRNHTGKWVRYDENGAMLKGWVTIEGALAICYPDQKGNVYYYDQKTGLMAKGWTRINGVDYYFDEITGVLAS